MQHPVEIVDTYIDDLTNTVRPGVMKWCGRDDVKDGSATNAVLQTMLVSLMSAAVRSGVSAFEVIGAMEAMKFSTLLQAQPEAFWPQLDALRGS